MQAFLANPYVARLTGAIGAGAALYAVNHDLKAAIITAVTFLVYGAAHSTATAVAGTDDKK